jgi:hypothetical protein
VSCGSEPTLITADPALEGCWSPSEPTELCDMIDMFTFCESEPSNVLWNAVDAGDGSGACCRSAMLLGVDGVLDHSGASSNLHSSCATHAEVWCEPILKASGVSTSRVSPPGPLSLSRAHSGD